MAGVPGSHAWRNPASTLRLLESSWSVPPGSCVGCSKPAGSGSASQCPRCFAATYCSPTCQERHWNAVGGHKAVCVPVSNAAAASRARQESIGFRHEIAALRTQLETLRAQNEKSRVKFELSEQIRHFESIAAIAEVRDYKASGESMWAQQILLEENLELSRTDNERLMTQHAQLEACHQASRAETAAGAGRLVLSERRLIEAVAEAGRASEGLIFLRTELEAAVKCPICHDTCEGSVVTRCCGHVFCQLCLDNHLKVCEVDGKTKQCPVCRADAGGCGLIADGIFAGGTLTQLYSRCPPALSACINTARLDAVESLDTLTERLTRAVYAGSVGRVKALLSAGADANATSNGIVQCHSRYPIIFTAIHRQFPEVGLLLLPHCTTETLQRATHRASLLHYACATARSGENALPLSLLATGAFDSILEKTSTSDISPLLYAIKNRCDLVVYELIVKRGVEEWLTAEIDGGGNAALREMAKAALWRAVEAGASKKAAAGGCVK